MTRWRGGVLVAGLVITALLVWHHLGLETASLAKGLRNAGRFAGDAFPPDWAAWENGWPGLVETLEIAFLATLIGLVVSLPLAMLTARNLAPTFVATPMRWVFAGIRVMPSLLWALLFVIMVGLGPLAGVLAMAFYSVGYLGKLQYEAIEGLPAITLDTADAMGVTKWQKVRHVVLPESANALLSQALFMFEYNVRASTIIGLVGAGGIGRDIALYLQFFQYDRVLALLVLVFLAVLAIDVVSLRIRAHFLEPSGPARARWRDLFPLPGR